MDLKETKEHMEALKLKIKEKGQEQAKLLKLQGLGDEILKREEEVTNINEKLETAKDKLAELRKTKDTAVNQVLDQIKERIDKLLPTGKSILHINEDGHVTIGWNIDKVFVRYEGLSGAQKVMFDQAMSYALLAGKTGILVYEAAEVDKENLKLLLERLKSTGFQVIVNTWYNPPVKGFSKILKDWNVIKL